MCHVLFRCSPVKHFREALITTRGFRVSETRQPRASSRKKRSEIHSFNRKLTGYYSISVLKIEKALNALHVLE